MVKVRATKASKVYNKALKEFHRIVEEGEVFEVTEERFRYLNCGNKYNVAFVELFTEEPVEQPKVVTKKVKVEALVCNEEPEIFIIEPGKEPVQVDENLKPIKKKTTKKKKVESSKG